MIELLDSLVQEYEQRIANEKETFQHAENLRNTSLRNIDRLEGAMLGVKDAIAKLNSTAVQSPEDNDGQQDIEASS